jgi:hypothetical protein
MSRVFDEKLIVFQLVRKFTPFYVLLGFIAMVTKAFHLPPIQVYYILFIYDPF